MGAKIMEERMRLEEEIRMSRSSQRQETYAEYAEQHNLHRSSLEQQTSGAAAAGGAAGASKLASDLITPVIVERATANMRVSPARNNFDVLIRVLEEPDYLNNDADDDVSSVLTEEERFRLREVILTDEKIQTILKETHTTEQMLMIKDYRQIEKIIHPQKWDVL